MLSIGRGERAAAAENAGFFSPLGLLGEKNYVEKYGEKCVVFLTLRSFPQAKCVVFLTLFAWFLSPKLRGFSHPWAKCEKTYEDFKGRKQGFSHLGFVGFLTFQGVRS